MRNTFNVSFVCRSSKVQKTGKAPVEMSIIINGQRTYLNLPRKEDPKEFKKTPLCQGIFDERPSISMTDYKNSANDKLRFFDTEDACKDEWNEILHYWELAAAKDNHFRLYMPKPYFLEVYNRGKKYRLYRLNIT